MKHRFGRNKLCAAAILSASLTFGSYANASDVHQYVPADTPFYMGSTAGIPMMNLSVSARAYQIYFDEVVNEAQELSDDDMSSESNALRFMAGVAQSNIEFGSDPSLFVEKFGYSDPMIFASYFSGSAPVIRYQLIDKSKFINALNSWNAEHKLVVEKSELGGVYFNRYMLSDADSDSSHYIAAIVAVQDDTAVFTLDYGDNDMLSRALGVELPEDSLASSGIIEDLNREWQYTDEFSGFLNIKLLMQQLLPSNGQIHRDLTKLLPNNRFADLQISNDFSHDVSECSGGIDDLDDDTTNHTTDNSADVSDNDPSYTVPDYIPDEKSQWMPQGYDDSICMDEVDAITDVIPQVVFGMRSIDYSANSIDSEGHMALQINHPKLMSALMMLRGHVSEEIVNENVIFSAAYGLDVAQWAPAMNSIVQVVQDLTPQCQRLATHHESLLQTLREMLVGGSLMNGMAPGFKGVSFAIYDVGFSDSNSVEEFDMENIDWIGLISSDEPYRLLQAASMLAPIAGIALPSDGTAVNLGDMLDDPSILPVNMSAAQKSQQIVFFNGDQSQQVSASLSESNIEKNGFMYSYVNLSEYMNIILRASSYFLPEEDQTEVEIQQMKATVDLVPDGIGDVLLDATANGLEDDNTIYVLSKTLVETAIIPHDLQAAGSKQVLGA